VQRFLAQLVTRPIGGQPLQQLGKFSDLADECQQDRLWVLELLPVTLSNEHAGSVADLVQVRHTREYDGSLSP